MKDTKESKNNNTKIAIGIGVIIFIILGAIFMTILVSRNLLKPTEIKQTENKAEKTPSEKIIEYLQNQYNEEFELVTIVGNTWKFGHIGYTATVYPKALGENYKFWCEIRKDGTCRDTYFQVLNKNKLQDKTENIVKKIDNESKCISFDFSSTYGGSGIGNKLSADEGMKQIRLYTYYMTTNKYSEKQIDELLNAFKEINYKGKIFVYSVQDKSFYNKVNDIKDFTITYKDKDKVKVTVYEFSMDTSSEYKVMEEYYTLNK